MTRSACCALALSALLISSAAANAATQGKAFEWTTQSAEAKKLLKELQLRIESFQGGPQSVELGKKIVALDPSFAMGVYYLSAVTPDPVESEKIYGQARELAAKASDGERRFIEAMVHARTNRGANFARSIPPLEALAADYPGERLPPVLLGQLYNNDNRPAQALVWFKKAQAVGTSPRIEAFIANDDLMQGRYAEARAKFDAAEKQLPKGAVPFPIRFGVTFSHLYEGNTDAALRSLETYLTEYRATGLTQQFPEVFIWNAIARVNLEAGRHEPALAAYKKGYESVPSSNLPEEEKKTWFARLQHGTARTHARMGRHKEALEGVEQVRQMIVQGGEPGRQFWPAYHYLAGYVKLETGDTGAALEHLLQANANDPFHILLLGRAYEKAGRKAEAKAAYERVVASQAQGIERALAFPEAKRKALSL
jgi:tetratricopeptide (TPR) repeat protein